MSNKTANEHFEAATNAAAQQACDMVRDHNLQLGEAVRLARSFPKALQWKPSTMSRFDVAEYVAELAKERGV